MDQQIAVMLQSLAVKLGTTTEYLWAVLIKQAPISAVTDVMQYAIFGVMLWLYIKYVKAKGSELEGVTVIFIFGAGVVLTVIGAAIFFCFPNTINAIVNPEYWAFNRVMNMVKHK